MPAFPSSVFQLGQSMSVQAADDLVATATTTPAMPESTTKVDLAIAYVKQYGEASRAELASAMGLESDSHVKSFLKTPLG